jgi:NAD(P)-dependent dehydrogenase (short-subunit alcohol dehydrogenase family)
MPTARPLSHYFDQYGLSTVYMSSVERYGFMEYEGKDRKMAYSIQGKTALVTGANRGIGEQIVEAFMRHDAAKVYAAVRRPESARHLIEAYGGKVEAIQIDLEHPESIVAAAKSARDVDIVVNNAGVLRSAGPLDKHTLDDFKFELEINTFGLIRMAQAFAPVLKANGGGAFVQLNSVASMKSFAGFSTYCASKAAAYSITQALRDVLKEQGTLVISVHPGPIATDMAASAGLDEMAEPASIVADAIIKALENEQFHAFPDTMAQQVGEVYQPFAENIVEADLMAE